LGEEDHVALITMHHIVCDGWSMGLLFRELAALYANARSRGPARGNMRGSRWRLPGGRVRGQPGMALIRTCEVRA
jgi:hypothetical protein